MKTQPIIWILLLLFPSFLFAQSQFKMDKEAIDQLLRPWVEESSPGVAVGIVRNGQIIYEQYLGYANLEHAVKINENTRFNIASNAKQFTALCVLQLMEEGTLKPEEDIRKHIPELYPHLKDTIVLSQLINHTSGIRDYCELYDLMGTPWWMQFIDNSDVFELLKKQEGLNFKPGSNSLYSNSNYLLLAEIIKRVTHMEFDEYAAVLFEKLDMPQTGFVSQYSDIVPHKARPYGNWNGWKEYPSITSVHGDGALYTTLKDQMKWEQIVQLNNGQYLSKSMISKSQLPLPSSATQTYGYGLMFDHYFEIPYHYHSGSTGAYNASFLRFPSHNTSIVLMTNNGKVANELLVWKIAKLVLQLPHETEKDTLYPEGPETIENLSHVKEITGIYKNDRGSVIRIVDKEGTLYREIFQRDPVRLLPINNGLFEYETVKGLKMNFSHIGLPDQKFTLYLSSQPPTTYHKMPDLNVEKTELNGLYYNAETDTEIMLEHTKDNEYSIRKEGLVMKAILVLKDDIRLQGGYEIHIQRNENDTVIGLSVNNDRIKQVIFTKKYSR